MKVVWRARARADLDSAISYIAKDNPGTAQSVRDRILQSAALLEQWADVGRRGRRADLRELVVPQAPYLIIYRRAASKVTILRIWHTSRKR